jgi:hypothetical protein
VTGRARGVLPAESEAAFQQKVVNLARFCGWRVYHPPDNRPSGRTGRVQDVVAGFPDLTMVRGPRLVFAELKAEKGRLALAQAEWLDALLDVTRAVEIVVQESEGARAAGYDVPRPRVDVFVWRPSDWPVIEEALKR